MCSHPHLEYPHRQVYPLEGGKRPSCLHEVAIVSQAPVSLSAREGTLQNEKVRQNRGVAP